MPRRCVVRCGPRSARWGSRSVGSSAPLCRSRLGLLRRQGWLRIWISSALPRHCAARFRVAPRMRQLIRSLAAGRWQNAPRWLNGSGRCGGGEGRARSRLLHSRGLLRVSSCRVNEMEAARIGIGPSIHCLANTPGQSCPASQGHGDRVLPARRLRRPSAVQPSRPGDRGHGGQTLHGDSVCEQLRCFYTVLR